MSLAVISAIIMTVLLIVMLVMGASISIAIGLSSAVAMLCMLPVDISLITSAQRIFTGANSFSSGAEPGGFCSYGRSENFFWYFGFQSSGDSVFYSGRKYYE